MTDFQSVADNVRSILHWADSANVDAVADAAEAYFAACEEANQRLLRCSGLLRKGLRSEAIHLAESEPNLLDAVALLDLPEMEQWRALLESNGLKIADPLLIDVAAELNEAYAAEEPLKNLLGRYRLQALSHSSLRDRIHTLSEIRRLDVDNPLRDDDLRAYEKARHKEISAESKQAHDQSDLTVLDELRVELVEADWLERPPKALVRQVASQYRATSKNVAREELAALLEPLEQAHAEWDVTAGHSVRANWTRWVKIAGLPDDDPSIERAAPALEWLANEDEQGKADNEFNAAVATLEAALDDESTKTSDLERCGYEVFRHERSIPDVLARRYKERVAALELSSSRRTRLIVAGAGVLGMCLILLVGWVIFSQLHGQRIADAKSALESLIESGRIDEVERVLTSLEEEQSRVYRSGPVQEIATQVRDLVDAEERRQDNFRTYIDQAKANGAERPDLIALRQATELAKSDEEQLETATFQAAVDEIRWARQKESNKLFQTDLDALLTKQRNLQQLQRKDFLAAEGPIRELYDELLARIAKSDGVSDEVRKRADTLKVWLTAREAEYDRIDDEGKYLQRIDLSIGDIEKYASLLDEYANRFDGTARSDDFHRVLEARPLWEGTLAWNAFAQRWRELSVLDSMPDEATDREKMAEAQITEFEDYPQAAILRDQLPQLAALAARRDSSGELIISSLKVLLNHPTMSNLSMATFPDGRQYYFKKKIDPSLERNTLNYIVDFDGSTSKVALTLGESNTTYLGDAAQSRLARGASNDLIAMEPEDWEDVFAKHIAQIGTDKQIDPIPQLILLKVFVETGRQGSSILSSQLARVSDVLQSTQLDLTVNWLKPREEEADRIRTLASDVVRGLPDLQKLERQIIQEKNQLVESTVPLYEWIGWLDKDLQGTWHVRGVKSVQGLGELTVVSKGSGNKVNYAKVGALADESARVDQTMSRHLQRGRPVYLKTTE